ncbi:hypothetical protein LPU83_pLPU83a_0058 (plasmid) [Rhizobium favelukesii]|uniref:Uncharacterized protein n=1 Tax=Rhizobium favelukesii TaxID=348824 RepID=W6RGD5_9HYPH|nr:hypothetical protein LPU83_pLPU83a_0058 [Rhizobium favelukesii]
MRPSFWRFKNCKPWHCLGKGYAMGFTCNRQDEVFIGGHTLRQVEHMVLKIARYQHCRVPLMAGLRFQRGWDYERSPDESLTLEKERDARGGGWRLHLEYNTTGGGVSGDVYDYVATVRRDRGTAYKMRTPGPPQEMKFILYSGSVHSDEKVEPAQIFAELSALHELACAMDESTATLEAWAKSGLAMRVRCWNLPPGGKEVFSGRGPHRQGCLWATVIPPKRCPTLHSGDCR